MAEQVSTLYIDGRFRAAAGDGRFTVFNPANGEPLASASDGAADETAEAISAAARAFPAWAAEAPRERARLLAETSRQLMEHRERLARTLTLENGKPLAEARAEVAFAADFFTWFAEEGKRARGEVVPSNTPGRRRLVIRQPVGVVGVITPWNLPLAIVARKVAPALAAGCTVVLKPAEQTPLCSVELLTILQDVGLPAGVANLVTAADPAPVGQLLLQHEAVAHVTFTGSTEVGRALAAEAGARLKGVSLELGGHAPFIVFDDADLDQAADHLVLSKFRNSGQTCLCANRVYVQEAVFDDFCGRLVSRVEALRTGDGMDPGVQIGPMIDRQGFHKVLRHVADAVERGARCLAGGAPVEVPGCEGGCFFAPTVLAGVDDEMLVCTEETFGPVAPLMTFTHEQEVLERANRSPYGLSGYVFTRDLGRAVRVSEGLQCGVVGVNDGLTPVAECPFGGMKDSGTGREGGWQGLDELLETKYITIGF